MPSYRQTFAARKSAATYDERVYARGTSAEILWRVEIGHLRKLAQEALAGRTNPAYLDFACGTGRILSHLEDLPATTTGIDISASMLERAQQKCKRASIICKDVTAQDDQVEGTYDLITSFRFLTNAEGDLRAKALARLHARLKDDGVLIVNTHSNPFSYRGLLLPYHWMKDVLRGKKLYGYFSNRKARQLLEGAGFRVTKVVGMGFIPQKLMGVFSEATAERLEQTLAGRPILQAFGINQIFVCTKKIAPSRVA